MTKYVFLTQCIKQFNHKSYLVMILFYYSYGNNCNFCHTIHSEMVTNDWSEVLPLLMLQCTENCGIYQRKTVIHHIQSSPYNPLIKGGTSQCPFGILRMYIYILIIYIEVTRKRRDYTFIPTSLFRDFSLIRGFYCQEYKNIHNHH